MTGWIIFGSIIALIAVILFIPLQVLLEYKDDVFHITARYAFFKYKILPVDQKKKEKREQQKLKKEQRAAQKGKPLTEPAKPEKRSLKDTIQMVKVMLDSVHAPFIHLLKRIRLTDIAFYMKTVGENAAETAVEVGRVNAYVYGFYAYLKNFFKVQDPDILITPDYYGEKSQTYFKMTVSLTPASALRASVTFGWRLIQVLIFKKIVGENVKQSTQPAKSSG
ncbi:DUF2953 domain-containing protein [Acetanaerobacterium elongatum]|uniref:DUF2953 domain-containing protein n=1 Tax=Acetanaerobacterium elongatum TaxID=258515 RepID=A0A1G9VQ41_9FIRM|nr:DUF2953 domain-containing protein [Acetanaerobacterium elongatum]SDM74299.1 Protein of unknown function [Acetanaerobacterium elongatum]